MNTCTSARRIARGHSSDPLALVAQLVDGSTPGATGAAAGGCAPADQVADPPVLFGAQFAPDGIDLFLHALDGHPTDALLGFVAPDDWSCIGVSSGAWASTYDGPPDRPVPTGIARRRVHLVYVVDRAGASVSIYREADQLPRTQRASRAAPERAGALDDHLRRALGIPTAEPGSTVEYFALRWIDEVFGRAVDGRLRGSSWAEVAGLHDALVVAASSGDERLARWGCEHLVRAGEILADAKPWSAVLEDTIEHREAQPAAAGDDVLEQLRWMDDGFFARTAVGRFPPLEDLLLDLHDLLEPAVYVRVVDTVEGWGLLR
jgi:hypothetical protein